MNRFAKKLVGLLSIAILLFVACTKDSKSRENAEEETIKTESLENVYGCQNTAMLLSLPELADRDSFYVINEQKDFDNYVKSTACHPQIDFEKYTLVIGKKYLSSGYRNLKYELKKITTADGDSLTLTVNIELNLTDLSMPVIYHVLIPKQPTDIPLTVHIEMKTFGNK